MLHFSKQYLLKIDVNKNVANIQDAFVENLMMLLEHFISIVHFILRGKIASTIVACGAYKPNKEGYESDASTIPIVSRHIHFHLQSFMFRIVMYLLLLMLSFSHTVFVAR